MKVEILNVGNEVLTGKVVNTNASFLSTVLEKNGLTINKVVTVGDDPITLKNEINSFLNSDIDYLITTGGLGPTHDDFTKEILFETVGLELVPYKEAADLLDSYFQKDYAKCNLKQVMYPKNSILLPNDLGTAMGAYVEHRNKMYTILVGPPFELIPMVNNYLVPILNKKVSNSKLIKEYIVMGIGESRVEEILKDYYLEFKDIETAPYASIGKVRYQITTDTFNLERFEQCTKRFEQLLNDYIITDSNEEIEEKVYQELSRLNYTISFGESCTGGMLASKLVNVSGSSDVLKVSYVVYSNESKVELLNVSMDTINKYDVVSNEVTDEMVEGLKEKTNSNVCVCVSGYCGPTCGSKKRKVGEVYYSIMINDNIYSFNKYFKTDRNTMRQKTSMIIYYDLYRLLKQI